MSAAKRDEKSGTTPEESADQIGKGRPTPSRRQAQAAKARPIVGSKDKELRREQRAAQTASRNRAREGMMQGDERYLTARDKGPQRRYVRDYVDARWNAGECLIPVMLVFLIVSLIPGIMQYYSIFFVWGFLFIAVIDAWIMTVLLKKRLIAKFGENNVQPGFKWYAAMRALQFRMLRMPKPQVKRGKFPE